MHTRKIEVGSKVVMFHYNSDMSGTVQIGWQDRDGAPEVWERIEIPGFVLLAMMDLSKEQLAGKLIAFLEQV